MKQTTNNMVRWYYGANFKGLRNLIDPRIHISRHISWHRSSTDYTDYTLPEPENYNRAIYTPRPQELSWVKDQVILKDPYKEGWITVVYLPPEEINNFDAWCVMMDMTYWRHNRPGTMRKPRPMLSRGASKTELSLDERLLTMGYYKNMVVKYFDGDPQYVRSRLGEARADLINLFNDE
jgi:hypothetical protein